MMKKILRITGIILSIFVGIISIGGVFLYITTQGNYAVMQTTCQDKSIPHIVIDSIVFHSETFGDKKNETVIIVHGGPGNDFRYLLPLKKLSEKYFVVFYDQRGSGLSPRVDANQLSLENSLSDLGKVIDYYAPHKKVNIIGHSWGGMLATGYLAKHPNRVNKIVLAEPGMLTSDLAAEFMKNYRISFSQKYLKNIVYTIFESLHIELIDGQERIDYIFQKIATINIKGNPMQKYYCEEDIANSVLPSWRCGGLASQEILKKLKDKEGNIQLNLISGLENYESKVLFLVSECNQVVGIKFQEKQMEYFENAEMKIIKNAGHTMIGEKTEESIKIIEQYFNEN